MNAHAYDCECVQCKSMANAISAEVFGSYVWSDADLERLAELLDEPCDCASCEQLRAEMER